MIAHITGTEVITVALIVAAALAAGFTSAVRFRRDR